MSYTICIRLQSRFRLLISRFLLFQRRQPLITLGFSLSAKACITYTHTSTVQALRTEITEGEVTGMTITDTY